MDRLFNNVSGYYLPAFLYIWLNDSIDFQNFENHSDEVKGTFIHEYCHFLQDVSTTYGYSNFLCLIQEFLYKVRKEKTESDKDIIEYNRDFHGLHRGDKEIEFDIFFINRIEVRKDELLEELYPGSNAKMVMVKYNGNKEIQLFAENEVWIIALCELSLLELDSGLFFIKVLRLMKEKKFVPKRR